MRFPALLTATVVLLAFSACGGGEPAEEESAGQPAAQEPAPQPPVEVQPAPAPPQPIRQSTPMARMDEPYTPEFTGTISPGMTRDEVVSVWGAPVTERMVGQRLYLYYRNGCEVSCGTFDVVFLDNGVVVDAIVRGPGHEYAGASSSPPGREAAFTSPIPAMP